MKADRRSIKSDDLCNAQVDGLRKVKQPAA